LTKAPDAENNAKIVTLREKKTSVREKMAQLARPPTIAIQNYYITAGENGSDIRVALSQNAMVEQFKHLMPEVCTINESLFTVRNKKLKPLKNHRKLAVAIRKKDILLDFNNRVAFSLPIEDFYEAVKDEVPAYESWSHWPRWPPQPAHLAIEQVETGPTGYLDKLISYFCPARPVDTIFLKALFVSPAWLTGAGKRPLFVIAGEGLEHDSDQGTGKSKVVHMLERLYNPAITIPDGLSADRVIALLQSIGSQDRAIIKLDNLRDFYQNPTIEAYITDEYIGGYKLNEGFSQLKNHFTWVATANSPHFNKDMASRAVLIKLKKPVNPDPLWQKNLENFIDDNKRQILADIGHLIMADDVHLNVAKDVARWGPWLSTILNKLDTAAHESMSSGQNELMASDDIESFTESLSVMIACYFKSYSSNTKLDPSTDCCLITPAMAWEVYKQSTAKRKTSVAMREMAKLARKNDIAVLKNNVRVPGLGKIRGYVLNHQQATNDTQVYVITRNFREMGHIEHTLKFGDLQKLI